MEVGRWMLSMEVGRWILSIEVGPWILSIEVGTWNVAMGCGASKCIQKNGSVGASEAGPSSSRQYALTTGKPSELLNGNAAQQVSSSCEIKFGRLGL